MKIPNCNKISSVIEISCNVRPLLTFASLQKQKAGENKTKIAETILKSTKQTYY
jgi:hypothetical protein